MANKKNSQPTPPTGSVVITPAALGFSLAMLVVGLVVGYLAGSAQAPATTVASSAPAPSAAKATAKAEPSGEIINNTDGKLRRLSEAEKQELLSKKNANDKAAPAVIPADSPYWTEAIQGSFADDVNRSEYERAVGLMAKGNARSAKPTLQKLADGSDGKAWREPALAMLAGAQASTGDIDGARKLVADFEKEYPKSAHTAAVLAAKGKTYQQEGKRARAPGQKSNEPPNDNQKKKYAEAIRWYDAAYEADKAHPAVADALLNKTSLHLDLGDFDKAERSAILLADSHAAAPNAPRGLANVGRVAFDKGDYATAERVYQRLVDTFPRDRMAQAARNHLSSLKLLGKPAPEWDVDEWIGTDLGNVADLKGKAVMVVFWATWCPHCRKAMPDIEAKYNKYKDDGLVVVGLTRNSRGQTTDKVREYLSENGYTIPIAIDPGSTSRNYGVSGIPAAAMIGKDGTVIFRNHPAQITDEVIEEALKGKS
jgi:thiol-disulfide isomerase/thioredoxin